MKCIPIVGMIIGLHGYATTWHSDILISVTQTSGQPYWGLGNYQGWLEYTSPTEDGNFTMHDGSQLNGYALLDFPDGWPNPQLQLEVRGGVVTHFNFSGTDGGAMHWNFDTSSFHLSTYPWRQDSSISGTLSFSPVPDSGSSSLMLLGGLAGVFALHRFGRKPTQRA